METPTLDRPIPESSAPWPLSAPESYVLLHGPRAKSTEAFKRGLLELVARDVLTVETRERPRFFNLITEQASFLHTGPNLSRSELAAQPLQAIWDIYRRTSLCTSWGDPRGVLVRDLPRSARALGTPLRHFTYWSVLPALVDRGLYERVTDATPRPPRRSRYTETTAGRAARVELESLMSSAVRDFSAATRRDPAAALALAGGLGSAIFLMDALLSEIGSIGQKIRDGLTVHVGLNTSSLDLDFDVLDLDARDRLDGVFDALGDLGSGWDAGWGGGDSGGGGDGGGWGDGDGGGGWGDGGGGD